MPVKRAYKSKDGSTCRPGYVLNPSSGWCVDSEGPMGKKLAAGGHANPPANTPSAQRLFDTLVAIARSVDARNKRDGDPGIRSWSIDVHGGYALMDFTIGYVGHDASSPLMQYMYYVALTPQLKAQRPANGYAWSAPRNRDPRARVNMDLKRNIKALASGDFFVGLTLDQALNAFADFNIRGAIARDMSHSDGTGDTILASTKDALKLFYIKQGDLPAVSMVPHTMPRALQQAAVQQLNGIARMSGYRARQPPLILNSKYRINAILNP